MRRSRRTAAVAAGTGVLGLALAFAALPPSSSPAASPDVVISEVYGGGGNSGAPYTHDYVELYNRGGTAVNLAGWSVQYASSSGTHWLPNGLTGTIEPGGHFLVRMAAGSGGNGVPLPAPDATGTTNMSLSSGKVALVTGTEALTCGGDCTTAPGVRDFTGYGSADDYETSPAPRLSNASSAQRTDPASDTDDNGGDFTEGAPEPDNSAAGSGDESGGETGGDDSGNDSGGGTCDHPSTLIREIQGGAHLSPLDGSAVSGVRGVVTATASDGFWFQDPCPDADPATSEGLFVYTSSAPGVQPGDEVEVDGEVSEYRPGGSSSGNLTTTELTGPSVATLGTAPLPAPAVIGTAGRTPPGTVIDDDASGSVETSGSFDPASDGIDFYESLEGMRVTLGDPVAVGPTSAYGEIPVVGDDGAAAGVRTARGGLVLRENDANPERVLLDDAVTAGATPEADTGDRFSADAVGVLDYSFGNFKLQLTAPLSTVGGSLAQETASAPGAGELAVATFNVENLSPADPQAKFDQLADQIVHHLAAPGILAVQEAQDNNGPSGGSSAGGQTWEELIDAIAAAGGPAYDYRQIDPQSGADGGQPGGNIRVGFLFRPDRVTFAAGTHGDATTAVSVSDSGVSGDRVALSHNPGRIDPGAPAFGNSRKPLVGKFYAGGEPLFVIANHFNSKGGDEPLFGRFQPPELSSESQRMQQAGIVADFTGDILDIDPQARVVVAGDLNDFEFSAPVQTLVAAGLTDLPATLPDEDRYTYLYEGNSQVLDHILISPSLAGAGHSLDVVHANAEFAVRPTDHDPLVAHLTIP